MKIFVSLVDAEGKKKTFALRQRPITIGRSTKADISICDELVSSIHCSIFIEGKQVLIEDQNSKNGLYLNGIGVKKQRIYIDDTIKLGNSFLNFSREKLDPPAIKLLTPLDGGNRVAGEIKLELETSKNQYKTNQPIKGKLYEGVQEAQKKVKLSRSQEAILAFREKLASAIDFFLSLSLLPIPFVVFYLYDREKMAEMFISDKNELKLEALTSTLNLTMLGIGILLIFLFTRLNRKKLKTSIGERLLGLN